MEWQQPELNYGAEVLFFFLTFFFFFFFLYYLPELGFHVYFTEVIDSSI